MEIVAVKSADNGAHVHTHYVHMQAHWGVYILLVEY